MNYSDARYKLNKPIRKDSKKLANNTYLIDKEKYIAVKLHDTEIIRMYPDYYELYTGGWKTHTTKERINTYSESLISQENNIWYIADGLFYEGIKINYDGVVISKEHKNIEEVKKKTMRIKKQVKQYVDKLIIELKKGLPLPSGGDCWYCAMVTDKKESLGDAFDNYDHLEHHIKENYYVPSLIVNAVKESGYNMPSVIIGYDDEKKMMGGKYCYDDSVRRSIYKYMVKRLLIDIDN